MGALNIKILAIDDDQDNLDVLQVVVKDAIPGIEVFTSTNGQKGLELALAEAPDVILLDIVMPGMDGFAACRRLKADERLKNIPVVFMTAAKTDKESRIKALEAGGEGFLPKPYEVEELVAQIRAMAKIKAAGAARALEKERLETLVAERTGALEKQLAENKLAEAALLDSKNIIEIVVENVPLMIFLKEAASRKFVMFNRAGEELLGYGRKALLGKNDLDFFPPEQAAYFMAKDLEVIDGSAGFLDIPEEPIQTVEKGRRLLHTRKVCVKGADGAPKYLLGISEDITDRKQTEEKLLQSQRMESVGRLAGGVAHDFNNILTAIKCFAEFIGRELDPQDPKMKDVREILTASDRAVSLTRQLLAFSRCQIMAPRVVDLNKCVADITNMLRRLIGEDIALETKLLAAPCLVLLDSGQMEQVLVNLVVNARDAMLKGGAILLSTELLASSPALSRAHPDLPRGPLVCLKVRDSGCGMSAEVKSHLFEPFFTTKEKYKGTGLGLSTVFGIVKQSGGDIEVESEPGKGAVFSIYFPYCEAAAEPGKIRAAAGGVKGRETILLVEDEESLLRLGRRVLEACGYTVISASDGPAALKEIKRHGKPVDLLLTDVIMPGMSGRDLARELARDKMAGRTLYMSGYTDDAIIKHGVLEPGIAFLYKPFTIDGLMVKVRAVLDAAAGQAGA